MNGVFKSFVDTLDNDLLINKPIVLVATVETARHAMGVDELMRPLFAFFRRLWLRHRPSQCPRFHFLRSWPPDRSCCRAERVAGDVNFEPELMRAAA